MRAYCLRRGRAALRESSWLSLEGIRGRWAGRFGTIRAVDDGMVLYWKGDDGVIVEVRFWFLYKMLDRTRALVHTSS